MTPTSPAVSPSLEYGENPFFELESDFDPIMIAAAKRRNAAVASQQLPATVVPMQSESSTTTTSSRRSATSPESPLQIIALGKTGDGKSSLLNDMLGREAFKHKRSVKSQTAEVQESTGFWSPLQPHMPGKGNFGCHVRVIDTPGFGDSQLRDGQFIPAIRKKVIQVAAEEDGLHCILLVFKISASTDSIMVGLRTLNDLMEPNKTFWKNVILVFTHADPSTINRYRSNKVTLKTKVGPGIKEYLGLDEELPMVFISTQKHMCSYFKGMGDCDCVHGSRYHADCRRRFYEQVWKRRHTPFQLDKEDDMVIHLEKEEEGCEQTESNLVNNREEGESVPYPSPKEQASLAA